MKTHETRNLHIGVAIGVAIALGVVIAYGLAALVPPRAEAQDGTVSDPFIWYNSTNLRITWNPYTEQDDIWAIGLQVYPTAGQPSGAVIAEDLVLTEGTQSSFPMYSRIQPLANGTYYFRLRAIKTSREASDWTGEFVSVKNWGVNPNPPSNIYVRP